MHRATQILSDARLLIESTTALIARTKYLRRSLNSQLKILRGVQFELESAAQSVKSDVQNALSTVKKADKNLTDVVQLLAETRVEDGFRIPEPPLDSEEARDIPIKESLYDFVDDRPVDELKSKIQAAISNAQNARIAVDQSIKRLDDDLQTINDALSDKTATSSSTRSDLHPPHMPQVLKSLEHHAREMAQSLESLVKHFDLCVTAIKHTEGGGAAVARTVNVDDLPEGVGVDAFETPAQPITRDERTEMLQVLFNDAAEVEDVVAELQERASEMESQLEQVVNWRETNEANYHDVATAFKLLEKISDRLPSHIAESSQFSSRWVTEKIKMEDGIAGMGELCDVYSNFLKAYDGMIVEAARRRTVRKRMEKIVQEAQGQLDQLYEDDLNEREAFRTEQGDFLPSDIWHGLSSLPARFAFQRLNDEGRGSVPELPKEAVAAALKRLKAAQGIAETER